MLQSKPRSQKPLPRQLDLPSRLPGLEASSRDADALPIRQLELVLVTGPWAGAVVWKMHARQRVWAEVVVAVGCVGEQVLALEFLSILRKCNW